MNKKLLIKWSDNWADEMDLEGFHIMSEKAWLAFLKLLDDTIEIYKKHSDNLFQCFDFCVGTNEEITYKSKEDFLKSFVIEEIDEEAERIIKNNFGPSPYGFFPLEQLFEMITEDSMEEDIEWLSKEIYKQYE